MCPRGYQKLSLTYEPLAKLEWGIGSNCKKDHKNSTQDIEITDLHTLLCYHLFANKITRERGYEAQGKDTMVDGEATTNFISMPGRMLHYPIDRTRKTLGQGA